MLSVVCVGKVCGRMMCQKMVQCDVLFISVVFFSLCGMVLKNCVMRNMLKGVVRCGRIRLVQLLCSLSWVKKWCSGMMIVGFGMVRFVSISMKMRCLLWKLQCVKLQFVSDDSSSMSSVCMLVMMQLFSIQWKIVGLVRMLVQLCSVKGVEKIVLVCFISIVLDFSDSMKIQVSGNIYSRVSNMVLVINVWLNREFFIVCFFVFWFSVVLICLVLVV